MNHVINSQLILASYDKQYPLIESGKGIYLYDREGRDYIDASGCTAAVSSIGHGVEQIAEAIAKQAKKLCVYPTHLFYNETLEHYLEQLCSFAPEGFNKAWTISGGTEAVENAIKLAFQYHRSKGQQRTKVIGRWGSYHGNSLLALDIGGMKVRRDYYTDLMTNHLHVDPCFYYRADSELSEVEYEDHLVNQFEQLVLEHKDDVICFIAEPIVGAALGAVEPTANYFKKLRKICDKYDVLMVADEVMTGFGRTGKNFGSQHFDYEPDILACAKGITSGYMPVGAVIAHDRVVETIRQSNQPFFSGQTYSCTPIAAATGQAVLNYLMEHNLVENTSHIGEYLKGKFDTLREIPCVGDVRGRGLFLGLEFVKDQKTKECFDPQLNFAKKLEATCLKNGLVTYAGRGTVDLSMGDHMLFSPPLTLTKNEADILFERLKKSLIQTYNEI